MQIRVSPVLCADHPGNANGAVSLDAVRGHGDSAHPDTEQWVKIHICNSRLVC